MRVLSTRVPVVRDLNVVRPPPNGIGADVVTMLNLDTSSREISSTRLRKDEILEVL